MQIIAMGGGGFSMEPENPLLDQYILRQTTVKKPKVCFIPTASGDSEDYIQRFYTSFKEHHCEPSHLSFFRPPTADLESFILDKDIIYVGGGNTKNMMAIWREWQFKDILKKAWQQNIILAGLSAGAICWFEEGATDSIPGKISSLKCLGFLSGSSCPHYDGEISRRPSYQNLIMSGQIMDGVAADDGAGVHYKGTEIFKIISSRPQAKAYLVRNESGKLIETELKTEYLGASQ